MAIVTEEDTLGPGGCECDEARVTEADALGPGGCKCGGALRTKCLPVEVFK